MPYDKKSELPENVTDSLPEHAQDIYLETFNDAYDRYKDPDERRGDAGREEAAHKVAWSAVKQKYHKENGGWVEN